jgi:ferric-dicitrate binding protein FerR (iron transport regulator)
MSQDRLQHLYQQWLVKSITATEEEEFLSLLAEPDNQALIEMWVEQQLLLPKEETPLSAEKTHLILQTIFQTNRVHVIKRTRWWAAAAAVLFLLSTGTYIWVNKSSSTKNITVLANDVPPGSNKAILTLSDGTAVKLDSTGNKVISKGIRQTGAQLQYDAQIADAAYNTLTTPRGGQFQLTLPDGTKVWLNAASSIYYPTAFNGKERRVEISGEVYFEIAKNEKMPFYVKSGIQETEVLGTHFNINAYTDENAISTTLLEGSIRVNYTGHTSVIVKPGQQTQLTDHLKVIDDADMDQAIAWKNGVFSFNQADIPTVMRQLSRWYNVDVEYAGAIPKRAFTGEIARELTLAQVLKGLTKTRVNYKIEGGNRIIILP